MVAKIFNKYKKISPRKKFLFWRKNKTQSFQKLFSGRYLFVFVEYLCNHSPKIKTKNIKNYGSILAIVNHRNWLDDSPSLRLQIQNDELKSTCSSIGLKSLSLSFRLNRYLFCRMLEAIFNPSFTCIIACFVSVAAAKGINYKQPFFSCRFEHNSFVSF